MNFKYYFPALVLTCVFLLSSCENKSASSSEEPVPSVCRLNCPDSVLVYGIAKDGKENLSCVWHYQYDANGNNIVRVRYSAWDFSVADSKIEMQYDAHNNLLERQDWSCNYGAKTLYKSTQWLMTYYPDDKMATMQMNFWYGEESTPGKNAIYSWLDDTHATTDVYAYHYMGDTTEWKLVDKAEYIYNADGNITYEKYIFSYYTSESARDKPIEYFFEYDRYGNCSSYKDVSYGKLWQYDTYAYSYDSDGNILVKRTYSNLSGEPVLQTKEVYFY